MTAPYKLIETQIPDFGLPDRQPQIPRATYRARIAAAQHRTRAAGLDALLIYADREHSANIAFLTGFEPRFEEALLVLAPGRDPVLITGPENQGYAAVSPLDLDVRLYPPFGLLGQDRTQTPDLADLLHGAGLGAGMTTGVTGWKYFTKPETAAPDAWIEAPAYIIDTLRRLLKTGRPVNAGAIFMHPATGLRASNGIDQIAQFEHAAAHVSEAVKRVIGGLAPGLTEFELAARMRLPGLPLSCHPMLSSGDRTRLGLASPSDKIIERGEPFQTAIGVQGALTCRAGWVAADAGDLPEPVQDYVDRLAGPYFACAAAWLECVGIGVTGGEIDALVKARLGDPFFGLALNPGHQIHLDEWMNTPIFPDSDIPLASGMALQLDIIPATGTAYGTANIEDGIALLDAEGRAELAGKYPGAFARIEARRAFMAGALGLRLKPEVLPLSNLAGCLAPFLLAPNRIFARA